MKRIDAVSDDQIREVILIDQKHLNYFWNDYQWDDYIKSYPSNSYLIMKKNEEHSSSVDTITSFALFLHNDIEKSLHLLKIISVPNQRQKGLAKSLILEAIEWMKVRGDQKIFLEVATRNEPAIKLYQSLGFKTLIEKKRFYSDGSNALSMMLDIDTL